MKRREAIDRFAAALEAQVPPRQRPALADLRDEMAASVAEAPPETAAQWIDAALAWTLAQFAAVESLDAMAEAFSIRMLNATDEGERQATILDLAEQLGADAARLDRDARAFSRYFDADAVLERYRRRVGERERAIAYGLVRAAELIVAALHDGSLDPRAAVFEADFAPLLTHGRNWRGDGRVRQSAHRALRLVAEAAGLGLIGFWVDLAVRDTRRLALDPEEDAWSQIDAMATLLVLSPVSLDAVLRRRLLPGADQASPAARDNRLFVRRALAAMLASSVARHSDHTQWLQRLVNDPDGAVRQAVAEAIAIAPATIARGLFARLRGDRDPQVRAMLLAEPAALAAVLGADHYLRFLERLIDRDKDEFVLRMALRAAPLLLSAIEHGEETLAPLASTRLRDAITRLRGRSDSVKVRRWAGMARERLWLLSDPTARAVADAIAPVLPGQREGIRRRIPALRGEAGSDHALVGRVLAVLAETDFGFDYTPGATPRLRRGDRFRRRWWRIIHEWRTSATDKRQAWLHTIGRDFTGPVIAPSARMAELAPTKVPGEPLHLGAEGGWRNFVPLLDHVLAALDRGTELQIYTSEGITVVSPPPGFWLRLRTFFSISRRFAVLAPLRNQPGNEYVSALRNAGIGIVFEPHRYDAEEPDPQITRLFGFGGAVPALGTFIDGAIRYFGTVYENSLLQLAVFITLASSWFVVRHIWRGRAMRRNRESIALVLGGWGTRGKSGTERLKAGLINALGHPLVSKTTGCEAMFLMGRSFGDLQEMFLFRPYDKATIWEQSDLVRTARGLGARVFLWECMGLTPSYVRVLQRDWMRDDLSTITNTYPDHEDVQGPAGRNIPEVMTQFIPEGGTLFTTEEEMYPILRDGAELVGTAIHPVSWTEAGLIHQSLLDRFPYAEHPYNIALVTAMAAELGLPADYAVKEMSDRVVADLGVLKIYPRSAINGRTLEFVMGMSANERFGAMGNWTRMGFAEHDVASDPEIYISTVVNNRADRVPRSRVFARILVEDVAADRHVLIGSNIDGLMGFIEESWAEYASKLSLFGSELSPSDRLIELARQQRVPLDTKALNGRLRAMLAPQSARIAVDEILAAAEGGRLGAALESAGADYASDIADHYTLLAGQVSKYRTLAEKVEKSGDHAALDQEVREFLRECFFAKLVPVREFYTPGEDIVRLIASLTPPGLINRIMGMQNIKGTGLDFVYRWQAWETCYRACQQARDGDPGIARRGMDLLSSFQEYGVLSDAEVRATVAALKSGSSGSDAQLDGIVARLDSQMADLDRQADSAGGGSGGGGKLGELVEAFLDSTDAVRRRRAADRLYRELIAEQISSQRAALELKKLTSRQKGGWLGPSIDSVGDVMRHLFRRSRTDRLP